MLKKVNNVNSTYLKYLCANELNDATIENRLQNSVDVIDVTCWIGLTSA